MHDSSETNSSGQLIRALLFLAVDNASRVFGTSLEFVFFQKLFVLEPMESKVRAFITLRSIVMLVHHKTAVCSLVDYLSEKAAQGSQALG